MALEVCFTSIVNREFIRWIRTERDIERVEIKIEKGNERKRQKPKAPRKPRKKCIL